MCPHGKPCSHSPLWVCSGKTIHWVWEWEQGARLNSAVVSWKWETGIGRRKAVWVSFGPSEVGPRVHWQQCFLPRVKSAGQSHLVHNKCFPSSNPALLGGLTDPQNWPTLGALRPRRRSGPTPGALYWNAVFYHIPEPSAHAILRGSALAPRWQRFKRCFSLLFCSSCSLETGSQVVLASLELAISGASPRASDPLASSSGVLAGVNYLA